MRRNVVTKKQRPHKEAPAQGRSAVSLSLPAGTLRALERVATVKMNNNKSRVVEAALRELFDRLQEPLRGDVLKLLREDDPVSRLRAELAEK